MAQKVTCLLYYVLYLNHNRFIFYLSYKKEKLFIA